MPALPPKGFAARPLVLHAPSADETWLRLYRRSHGDPLGLGKGPSRFSDPRPQPAHESVPTDAVRASDQALGQAWALAFHEHDTAPDGLIYPSRLNGEDNIALFDRALAKVRVAGVGPLLDRRTQLAAVIRALGLAIL